MPELPEVETVKRVLEPQIKGQKIKYVDISNKQVIAYPDAEAFCDNVIGQTIVGIRRRGKFLNILFESGDRMVLHLRMTGCLLITPSEYEKAKHTHAVFSLKNGNELRYIDTRRFGRFWFLKKDEEDTFTGIDKLGLEPFDKNLTGEYLHNCLLKRKKPIKECLLEQSMVAGIGNIYGDEILFAAGLCPSRPANSLTWEEYHRLAKQISVTLAYFIEKNAISPEDYLAGKGKDYRNTPYLKVYGHEKEKCLVCGHDLKKIILAGRSSVFCPNCQRETP
ncbi:DNA-formamidopyrimidine glycosylase [Clostridium sp. P21]|uniref:Formamidopyrimidine-DNA glycosylase n=1 Tax=Clostridium muellerianum TaxID=2716538 RepID=A0A7Y0ELS7_9CLOT|nr:DNA-formamidopyrimidine glycosylase [Clostridium muellerianum]NMM65828.1 DNA-formamidopyrimidine glycosylase [Clostridium muellerianum]